MDANGVSVRNNTDNRKSLYFLFVYVLVLAYKELNDDIGQRNIRGNDVSETTGTAPSRWGWTNPSWGHDHYLKVSD